MQVKGYPFEVIIPEGLKVSGAILSDRVKNLDWKVRKVDFIDRLPDGVIMIVLKKLNTLLS